MVLKMENMKLNISVNKFTAIGGVFKVEKYLSGGFSDPYRLLTVMQHIVVFALLMVFLSPEAFAQAGGAGSADAMAGLCKVAGWVQKILTAAAVIAVLLYVINSFFMKSSVVGDIILYVIIGCAIAAAVIYLIGLTGLSTSGCSLT